MKRNFTISGLVLLCFLFINSAFAQNVTVKGTVTDATTNEALVGVSVGVKGTAIGAQTDVNGAFSLSVPSNATLVFTSLGYTPQEVAVNGQATINIKLKAQSNALSEVVVVGYGTQRKIDVTGSVSSVKGSEISKQASVNPISSLQGKVAGVQITNSGAPGSTPEVHIRGVGTVYGNANPLYVVDGIWSDNIDFINPADIENISVLKDASSEAIYGIRAANGVILVTTKKGSRNTKAIVNYDGFVGNQVITNNFKMANGPEYATLVDELDVIGGGTGRYPNPNNFGTTDWTHQIFRNAFIDNQHISVSGGGEKSTYNVAFGYLDQEGTVNTNSYNRYTLRVVNEFEVAKGLKLGYDLNGAFHKSRDINNSIFHEVYAAVPIVPVRYANGAYGDPNDYNVTSSALFNPQVDLDFFNQHTTDYRANGTVYADLKFAKHFTFHSSVGGDYEENEVNNYVPVFNATFAQLNTKSKLTETDLKTRNWIIENTLTYDNHFGDHALTVLLGQSAQSYKYTGVIASAEDVPDYGNGHYFAQGDNFFLNDISGGYPSYSTVNSYFARANYSFKGRYLLNATMRADGSSKFSGNNRWGYFPSVGAGWVISEEDFMKDQKVFNTLKLRGSWGKIGNVSVPSNLSVTTLTGYTYVSGQTTIPAQSVASIVPPTTYWERGVGTDIGLEASLLDNRLYGEFDFYNKKTEKAIFDIPILGSLGTSGGTIIGNQATFQNQGVEIVLTWKDKIGKDFTYSLSGNIGINNNKVLSVSTGANPIYQAVSTTGSANYNTRTMQGEPIGEFFGLKVDGIFQTQAEIDAYSKNGNKIMPNAVPGNFKYDDVNHDGVIDDKDRVVLGNPNPKYTYGFSTYFAYKQFDLTADFQGIAGVQIYDANSGIRFGTENFSQDFYDNRWHGPGTSNTYPSVYIAGGQNNRSNSFYVQDGSYFRIRNLQLGYTLPSSLMNRLKISKLRVFANAQNAFNFFKYKGFNPEVGGDPTRAGVDSNVQPLYATYNLGVSLTF